MVMQVGDDVTVNGKIVAGLDGRTILIQLKSGAYALIHDEDINTIRPKIEIPREDSRK